MRKFPAAREEQGKFFANTWEAPREAFAIIALRRCTCEISRETIFPAKGASRELAGKLACQQYAQNNIVII
jgi:hypothetical protein